MQKTIVQALKNPLWIILGAALLRILPHPPNFAPIAALALFGGAHLGKKYALLVPLAAMLLSDIFLGFHSTMPYVYGSFAITGVLGLWLKERKTMRNTVLATLASSLLFFFITNFGVWAATSLYSKTVDGLLTSYAMGLPFLRNTMLGDFFYVTMFFGAYEAAQALSRRLFSSPLSRTVQA